MQRLVVTECKGKGHSGACYSATYTSRSRDQKHFTISQLAADWHELMIPQRIMQLSIARISKQLDPWFDASRHTTTLIGHTSPSRVADTIVVLVTYLFTYYPGL